MTALIVSSVLAAGLSLLAAPVAAAGDVTVQVDDVNGNGIEGADVTVYDAADDSSVASGPTDSNGTFTASGVSDGDYYAAVDDPSYVDVPETENVTITASNAQIDVELIEANELVNNTVAVSNDTESAYADVSANSSLALADNSTRTAFEVVGINNSNGNETVLEDSTKEVPEDSTTSFEYVLSDSDRQSYDEIRVIVDGQTNHTDDVEGGTLESARGGGGGSSSGLSGLLSVSVMGIPVVAILVVTGIGLLIYRSDGQ
jgi:hypothetical protein